MPIYIVKSWYKKESAPVAGTWVAKTWTGLTDFEGQDTFMRWQNSRQVNSTIYYIGNGIKRYLTTSNESSGSWSTWSPSGTLSSSALGRDVWSVDSYSSSGWSSANYYSNGSEHWSVGTSSISTIYNWNMAPNVQGRYIYRSNLSSGANYFYGERPYPGTNMAYLKKQSSSYSYYYDTSEYQGIWTKQSTSSFDGCNVWDFSHSDSSYSYFISDGEYQSPSIWVGLTNFEGQYVWRDNTSASNFNVYYSKGTEHYILDKSTYTWSPVSWNGLTSFNGNNVWHFNGKVFYSEGTNQYQLQV